MLRVISVQRPTYVLAENVYGLVTLNGGMELATVYSDLEAEQYEVSPAIVFPAAALGAPHRRDRVWICAYTRFDWRRTQEEQQQEERTEEPDRIRKDGPNANSKAGQPERSTGQEVHRPEEVERPGRLRGPLGRHWESEPDVGRVATRTSSRLDRLRGLGNAVVPQCAELVGRKILDVRRLQTPEVED